MATKFKFEIESDGLTFKQAESFSAFVQSLQNSAFVKSGETESEISTPTTQTKEVPEQVQAETPRKKRASKAREVEPEEAPIEEVTEQHEVVAEPEDLEVNKPEEIKTTAYSLQDVRARVQEKIQHRAQIKDKLSELGASSVSLLEPSKFEEMVKFLDSLK